MQKDINYDLIIFDCDGTLADSEIAHNTVLLEQLHALGLTEYTMEKTMETYMGRAVTDIVESIESNYSVRFPDHHWQTNEARYRELLPAHIRMDDTTHGVVKRLHDEGRKITVGSNGTRDNVIETLKAANLKEFFPDDFVFTFETVENPKPAPDLYLHVCEAMHVAPRHALVIEDTITGATAGIAAGIDTIGYVGLTHREGQAERLRMLGCKHVIESMAELADILYPNESAVA